MTILLSNYVNSISNDLKEVLYEQAAYINTLLSALVPYRPFDNYLTFNLKIPVIYDYNDIKIDIVISTRDNIDYLTFVFTFKDLPVYPPTISIEIKPINNTVSIADINRVVYLLEKELSKFN